MTCVTNHHAVRVWVSVFFLFFFISLCFGFYGTCASPSREGLGARGAAWHWQKQWRTDRIPTFVWTTEIDEHFFDIPVHWEAFAIHERFGSCYILVVYSHAFLQPSNERSAPSRQFWTRQMSSPLASVVIVTIDTVHQIGITLLYL